MSALVLMLSSAFGVEELLDTFARQAAMRPNLPLLALRVAARVMRRRVTRGQTEDVLDALPEEIRELLE